MRKKMTAMLDRLKRQIHADTAILAASVVLLVLFFFVEGYPKWNAAALPKPLGLRCMLLVLICLISYLGGLAYRLRTGDGRLFEWLLTAYFVLYLYLVLSLTLMDETLRLDPSKLEHSGVSKRAYYMKWYVNFHPFESIWNVYVRGFRSGTVNFGYMILNLFGNLCAFMPMSFFLPRLWRAQRHWYVFLPTVTATVAAIEGTQLLLMVGSCDVDDVILNAGGAFVLFWILKIPPLERLCCAIWTGDFGILSKQKREPRKN